MTATPGVGRGPRQVVWPYYGALALLAVFSSFPLLVLFFNGFKSDAAIGSDPLGPPRSLEWANFTSAWVQGNIGGGLMNSAIITVGTVLGTWVVTGLGAFAMARLRLPGLAALLFYLFVMIALPVQMFLVPLFFLWSRLHLYDTLAGIILIHVALGAPFSMLLLRSYLLAIPKDYDEAARLDGASDWMVLRLVILPLSLPGFLTIGLVSGLRAYNDLFFASIFIQTDSKLPVSTAFLAFQQGFTRDWGLTSAAGVIIMLPFLLLFLSMQRRFVEGLTSGGLKG
jgi:raffinose/stachyose/melibiose transport system permease protein